MAENVPIMDPNYVPDEFKTPYDIVELPSQGLLYKNKKNKVKIEYLTAMDESILSSPNLSSNPTLMLDILLERKVKDLGFPVHDLLEGDRIALLIFLRASGLGEIHKQIVWDEDLMAYIDGEVDLTKLKQKKLLIKPGEDGEFEYVLPISTKKIKFKFLTGKDEADISDSDESYMKRNGDKISNKIIFRLEKSVTEFDGNRDKIFISNSLKKITIKDSRSLRKYMNENEPGLDYNTTARIPGGGSVPTFFRFNQNFLWPEL